VPESHSWAGKAVTVSYVSCVVTPLVDVRVGNKGETPRTVLLTLVLLLVSAELVDLDQSIVTPEVLAMGVEAFWVRRT
jgi:hypothetical protein